MRPCVDLWWAESIFSEVRKELVPLLHDVVASAAMKQGTPHT